MKYFALTFVAFLTWNGLASALPVLDKVKVVGEKSEVALIPDHLDPNQFYYIFSAFDVCRKSDGVTPEAMFFSNTKSGVPYVSISYTLCPSIAANAGASSSEAVAAIEAFKRNTGARILPLTPNIEVRPDGLWRSIFDKLQTHVVYECTPDANEIKIRCNLFGEGGGKLGEANSDPSDATLLYELYIQSSFALNGYFYSPVTGYIEAKPDTGELEKITRDSIIAFWAEPNFVGFPANTHLNWQPR